MKRPRRVCTVGASIMGADQPFLAAFCPHRGYRRACGWRVYCPRACWSYVFRAHARMALCQSASPLWRLCYFAARSHSRNRPRSLREALRAIRNGSAEIILADDLPVLAPSDPGRAHPSEHTSRCSRSAGSGGIRQLLRKRCRRRSPTWSSSRISRGRQRAKSKPLSTSSSWPSTSTESRSKPGRRRRLGQEIVERPDRDLDDRLRLGTGRHPVAVERRQRAGDVQRPQRPALCGRRARDREHAGRARLPERGREIGLRLDQNAAPAELLEMPGLRRELRPVGADLDEESGAAAAEELAHQLLLASVRPIVAHAISDRARRYVDCGARDFRTIRVVLKPGTRSTRMTSPPSPSTISWPTTCSRR